MHAEKITSLHQNDPVHLDSGMINSMDGQSYQITTLAGCYTATRAFSCLVEPQPEDTVLFSKNSLLQCKIISILERPENTDTSLVFPGNVSLKATQGQLNITSRSDITISAASKITQVSEEFSLLTRKALLSIDHLNAIGSLLVAKIRSIQTIADSVETVADHWLQKLKNSFRQIDGVDQTRSRDTICTVKNLFSMRSRQAAILAKKDIKIDAERIHMG